MWGMAWRIGEPQLLRGKRALEAHKTPIPAGGMSREFAVALLRYRAFITRTGGSDRPRRLSARPTGRN